MKLSLVVVNAGKTEGQAIPIKLAQFIIGRDPQCNLRPASPVISKRHCAILVKNGKVFIRDFDSTNGTFVNDKQVKGEFALVHNDILKIGPLTFRVSIEATVPPVDKPTPLPPKAPAKSSSQPDDVAAMLLSLDESEATASTAKPAAATEEDSSVPGGSTVMDMIPVQDAKPEEEKPKDKAEPAEAGKAHAPPAKKPAPPPGDARQAAKAILEKYVRRQRS